MQLGLLSTILAVAAGLVILLIIYILINAGSRTSDIYTCRSSVFGQGRYIETPTIFLPNIQIPVPLVCSSENIGVLKGTREEVKKQIANLMGTCWFMYADGKIANVFDTPNNARGCNVCFFFEIPSLPAQNKIDGETPFSESVRPENTITENEMKNYLLLEVYNPPVATGGGTGGGVGGEYEFDKPELNIEALSTVKVSTIRSVPDYSYVMDYSARLSASTIKEIDVIAAKLYVQGRANTLVVVADNFNSINRKAARQVFSNTGINKGDYAEKGLLIMIDLEKQIVRIHAGENLRIYMENFEIVPLIESTVEGKANLDEAVLSLIKGIEDRIFSNSLASMYVQNNINPRSYQAYMQNSQLNRPLIVEDIVKGRLYAVSFLSTSTEPYANNVMVSRASELNQYCLPYAGKK